MRNCLIILLLLHSVACFSQEKAVDSVLRAYKKCTVDTAKIDILLSAASLLRDAKPEKAIEYGKEALKIALGLQDKKRESQLLDLIGQGNDQTGNIAEAISYYNKSFNVANENHDIKALGNIMLNLGACYTDVYNYRLGIEYYTKAVEYFSKLNAPKDLCKSEIYLSDALFKSNNTYKALYYLQKAMQISTQQNGYMAEYIYVNQAECYYRNKEFGIAKMDAEKGIDTSKKINDLYLLCGGYTVLGKVYMGMGDLKKAEEFGKKALEIARGTNIKENLIDCYDLLCGVYEKKHDYAEALKYKEFSVSSKDSLESSRNQNLLQAYVDEKKDGELLVMKADEMRKDAELKHQHLITGVVLVVLLLVIGIGCYVLYSRNKLQLAKKEIEKAYGELDKNRKEIIQQNNELIENNKRILQQSEHIEELNRLKDRLFSIIAHDLRSPLTSLKGILNLLAGGNLSQEKFQTILPQLLKGVTSTYDLVENLLHWSKSQLEGEAIVPENFDISLLSKNLMDLFEKQASDKSISLYNEISTGTLVFADKGMMDIVLRNLVANAIKFCYPNSQIIISSNELENKVEINVRDTGTGISSDNIKRMFQLKERFTTMGTNKEIGTGLGLILCKDFVEKNHGEIGVESKENEGSKFWFRLPKGK